MCCTGVCPAVAERVVLVLDVVVEKVEEGKGIGTAGVQGWT